jgi:nuclear transport factor 2 (NTF2) superfamily protein
MAKHFFSYPMNKIAGVEMSDEKILGIVRDFIKALVARDVDKVLSFFPEDGDWTNNAGVFKGKDELRRYLKWARANSKNMNAIECGNGVITQSNKAFIEQTITFTVLGKRVEYVEIVAWEFDGDKIKRIRTVSDRLLIAQQAAKGWLPKLMVKSIINQFNKGLN